MCFHCCHQCGILMGQSGSGSLRRDSRMTSLAAVGMQKSACLKSSPPMICHPKRARRSDIIDYTTDTTSTATLKFLWCHSTCLIDLRIVCPLCWPISCRLFWEYPATRTKHLGKHLGTVLYCVIYGHLREHLECTVLPEADDTGSHFTFHVKMVII